MTKTRKNEPVQIDNSKEQLVKNQDNTNRLYKDRLFKFIFGNSARKAWSLSLLNALNGTNYTNEDDLEFNTIDDAVYMGMKNDVSFIFAYQIYFWEHQSSYNPNMPIRCLLYAAHVYEKYFEHSKRSLYSSKLQKIPAPHFICFYNGPDDAPDREIQRLSRAFNGNNGMLELEVLMININYGRNNELMEKCQPLKEYAWFVNQVRLNQQEGNDMNEAVDRALDSMPDDFIIHAYLQENRAEVKDIMITEYNEEKEMAKLREEMKEEMREEMKEEMKEEMAKLRKEEREEGEEKRAMKVATKMIEDGFDTATAAKYSMLSKEQVLKLKKELGK